MTCFISSALHSLLFQVQALLSSVFIPLRVHSVVTGTLRCLGFPQGTASGRAQLIPGVLEQKENNPRHDDFFFFSDCRPGLVSLCKGGVPLDSVKAWTQKWVNPLATINKLHHFKGRKQPTHSILHWSLGNRAQHFSKYQLLGWRIFQKESLTWWKWVRPTRAWPFACPDFDFQEFPLPWRGSKKSNKPH